MNKLLVHFATDRNAGEFRRIARISKDMDNIYGYLTTEVIILPISMIFNLKKFRDNLLGERVVTLPIILPLRRFSFVRRINDLIKKIALSYISKKWAFDIVVGETLSSFQSIKHLNIPKVVDIHGAYPEEILYTSNNVKFAQEMDALEEEAMNRSEYIIVQSYSMKNHLQKKYSLKRTDIKVYNCGVDTELFDYSKIDITQERKKLGYSNDDVVFIYTGGTHRWQLLYETIDMFKEISQHSKNVQYLMLLQGDIETVKRYCAHMDNIKILHNVPFNKVNSYLSISDFAWLLRENVILNQVASPTKLGEYLACGQIVITSDVARHWEWINPIVDKFCIVDYCNIKDSADKIIKKIQELKGNYDKKSIRAIAINNLSAQKDYSVIKTLF